MSVKEEIGFIKIEDYETIRVSDIVKMAQKANINLEQIKTYKENVQLDECRWEERLILYYSRAENDKEYNERIEQLEVNDFKEFLKMLAAFNLSSDDKKKIKALYDKLCIKGKWRGLVAGYQKPQLERFFTEVSVDQAFRDGLKQGRLEGQKEILELKKNLLQITA